MGLISRKAVDLGAVDWQSRRNRLLIRKPDTAANSRRRVEPGSERETERIL